MYLIVTEAVEYHNYQGRYDNEGVMNFVTVTLNNQQFHVNMDCVTVFFANETTNNVSIQFIDGVVRDFDTPYIEFLQELSNLRADRDYRRGK